MRRLPLHRKKAHMLKGLRTAIKYFALGLLAGVIFAPRKGSATLNMLMGRRNELVHSDPGVDSTSNASPRPIASHRQLVRQEKTQSDISSDRSGD